MPQLPPPDASAVKRYLNELQDRITTAVENADSVKFRRDTWARPEGGGGESRRRPHQGAQIAGVGQTVGVDHERRRA